ncbi:hypothetical protein LJB98_02555 [Bacteroidales bacterium OttesenSCG-928-M11]|nr:hypothetical protein [Bacteroidales bacterium OttesenSCG-928-M11]
MKIKHMGTFGIKIKKTLIYSLFVLGAISIVSCDPFIKIRMNDSLERSFNLPCGNLSVRGRAMGKQLFTIDMRYDLIGELWLNPDSLEISYKSTNLEFELWEAEHDIKIDNKMTIKGSGRIFLSFDTFKNARTDTIIVNTKGFLSCEGKSIFPDTISIIIDK